MTSNNLCANVISKYLSQLSGDFSVAPSDRGCYIATPFTRPDGEIIEFELTDLPSGPARLGDMGETLGYLYVNGLTLTRGVLDKARNIARGYGISFERNALVVEGNSEITGEDLHRLLQATLAVTALVQSRRSTGRVIFDDEVESLIIQTGVTYDSDYRLQGLREAHTFMFYVNSRANLLIQPLSAATESAAHSAAERWAYRFHDTIQQNDHLRPVVVLDDRKTRSGVWDTGARAPISEFAILWEDKERLEEMLVAVVQ